ncbi:MAG: hypothetical protein LAO79_00050 [Acidobacteriia bacterium]|nr:hypothetical protein [Terriglobia bacterium]
MKPTVSGRFIVAAIVVITAVVVTIAAVMLFGHPRGRAAPPPSIAVFPLVGDSTGAVTSEVIDALKPIPNFQVADAALYAGKRWDTRTIGEKLNVRTLLDGSTDGAHVTVKLINAADSFELWSHTYERTPAFKETLARDVESHLSLK